MAKEAEAATAEAKAAPTADKAGAGAAGEKAGAQGKEPREERGNGERMYTQADVDRIADKIAERQRREADERVKTLESEAEKKRLEEQGKWQEVAAAEKAEKEALLAEKRHNDFRTKAREKLNEKGLSKFEDILLGSKDTVEKVADSAAAIDKMIEAIVEERISARLDTGKRPAVNGAPTTAKAWGEMKPDEWKAQKAALGIS